MRFCSRSSALGACVKMLRFLRSRAVETFTPGCGVLAREHMNFEIDVEFESYLLAEQRAASKTGRTEFFTERYTEPIRHDAVQYRVDGGVHVIETAWKERRRLRSAANTNFQPRRRKPIRSVSHSLSFVSSLTERYTGNNSPARRKSFWLTSLNVFVHLPCRDT